MALSYNPDAMRAYRVKTYSAAIVPPTMLLVAAGLVIALLLNWYRDRPNLDKITLSVGITVGLILFLFRFVRSVATSGRTLATGLAGLLYVTVLSTNISVVSHYNHNGVQQAIPLCSILAVASAFFWPWEWQFVASLVGIMGPPVLLLFIDDYSGDTRYIFCQVIVVTILVCIAFYLYLRHINIRNYTLMIEVEHRAAYDGLTGLLNRTEWFERAGKALRAPEHSRGGCALLFVDINKFKVLNDREGHVAGDHMLKCIAVALRESGPEEELVGRFGGDEFVILAPGLEPDAVAHRVARFSAALEAMPNLSEEITASVGIAHYEPGETLDSLVHRADEAMFVEKARTRVLV